MNTAKPRTHHIKDLAALREFAASFAASLAGGEVVGLVGELGAGKTAFTKEVASALGVKDEVKSPTFILMRVFDAGRAGLARGIARLCHVDAYRLEDRDELRDIGFLEYAADPATVTFVEWADRVPEIRRLDGYRELVFSFDDGEARVITECG